MYWFQSNGLDNFAWPCRSGGSELFVDSHAHTVSARETAFRNQHTCCCALEVVSAVSRQSSRATPAPLCPEWVLGLNDFSGRFWCSFYPPPSAWHPTSNGCCLGGTSHFRVSSCAVTSSSTESSTSRMCSSLTRPRFRMICYSFVFRCFSCPAEALSRTM